jgi:hypothetical protein
MGESPRTTSHNILSQQKDRAMPTEGFNNLVAFKEFIESELSTGDAHLTVDEVVAPREIDNHTAQKREEPLEAIRVGFADL